MIRTNRPRGAAELLLRNQASRAEIARRSLVGLALGAAALFALLAQLGENGIVSYFRLRAEAAALQDEVTALEDQNERMQEILASLASDSETLERIARRYGFRRPGEEVLTVRPRREPGAPAPRRVP